MFESGMKIQLVASSCRKPTGPKRGSIGYVSTVHDTATLGSLGVCASVVNVFFFRYGFEKRTRVESRDMLMLFPIVDRQKGDIQHQVLSLVNKVSGRNNEEWTNSVQSYFGGAGLVTTVAAPVACTGATIPEGGNDEVRACIESFLHDPEFCRFAQETHSTNHFRNSKIDLIRDGDLWHTVNTMLIDRAYKENQFKNWFTSDVFVKNLIFRFRVMSLPNKRLIVKRIIEELRIGIEMTMPRDKSIPTDAAYGRLASWLMINHIMQAAHIIAENVKLPKLLEYVEDIDTVRAVLGVLSASIEKENFSCVQ